MNYVVEAGDTIESIARKYDLSPSALMQMNNLTSSNQLRVGMIITIRPSGNCSVCNAPLGPEWCPRLSRGSRGPAVEELQRRLMRFGYFPLGGRVDGFFGQSTEQSLRNFQRDNNLWVTGVTDQSTWRALGVVCRQRGGCPTLRLGSRGSAIAFLQSLLQRRGYFVNVDGVFGNATQIAVRALQRDSGLFPSGEVNQQVWDVLGVTCVPNDQRPGNMLPNNQPPVGGQPGDMLPNNQPPVGGQPGDMLPDKVPPIYDNMLPPFQPPTQPPSSEPGLNGLNYNWEEIDDFRYVLATDRYRYREGQPVEITFRKRNLTNEPAVLRYPSSQLFDFYVSDAKGVELWRWSRNQDFNPMAREMILAPGAAESITINWDQKTNNGYWIPAQTLTLWGTNMATGVSLPLNIEIY